MTDIELVIKIPEELYETYKDRPPMLGDTGMDMIAQSIANGTPLPEHHGNLKDEREVVNILLKYAHSEQGKRFANFLASEINDAPTIIEGSDSE